MFWLLLRGLGQHHGCLSNQTEAGDFNLPDVNCEYYTADKKHHTEDRNRSRRFLEHLVDNVLVQVLKETTRKGVLFDLLFVNKEGLYKDLKNTMNCLKYCQRRTFP